MYVYISETKYETNTEKTKLHMWLLALSVVHATFSSSTLCTASSKAAICATNVFLQGTAVFIQPPFDVLFYNYTLL